MAGSTASSGAFVIIADFEVKADKLEQFLELARTDASQSVAVEPGCQQFDVTLESRAACPSAAVRGVRR